MMATSSLSLFPATTVIAFSEVFPEQSRWIFGGSGGKEEILGNLEVGSSALLISRQSLEKLGSNSHTDPGVQVSCTHSLTSSILGPSPSTLRPRSPGSQHPLPHTQ